MRIQESGEMYLESIFVLAKSGKPVRSVDVGEYMGYSKPSVSRAIGLLKSAGLVNVGADGHISLTESGLDLAQKIYERHTIISSLLTGLGVSEKTASEDACRIEHVISDETFEALKNHSNLKFKSK